MPNIFVFVSSHIVTYLAIFVAIATIVCPTAILRPSRLCFDIPLEWIHSETYVKAYNLYNKRDKMIRSIRLPGEGMVYYVLSSSQSVHKAIS